MLIVKVFIINRHRCTSCYDERSFACVDSDCTDGQWHCGDDACAVAVRCSGTQVYKKFNRCASTCSTYLKREDCPDTTVDGCACPGTPGTDDEQVMSPSVSTTSWLARQCPTEKDVCVSDFVVWVVSHDTGRSTHRVCTQR